MIKVKVAVFGPEADTSDFWQLVATAMSQGDHGGVLTARTPTKMATGLDSAIDAIVSGRGRSVSGEAATALAATVKV